MDRLPDAGRVPEVSTGRITHIPQFPSNLVSKRAVDVWLPEGYRPDRPHNVLYMHDGQMLFDDAITWNKQSWRVADVVGPLIASGVIEPCIVVGIWNSSASRHSDYFPQKPFETLPAPFLTRMHANADDYLRFLVNDVKPHIDHAFATRPERQHTFVAGSSMGGLISLYALCEYPDVFGGAACLSTHWIGFGDEEENPVPAAFLSYIDTHLPPPAEHKLYFDYGTETLDAHYEPHQQRVDALMEAHGYDGRLWQTRKFEGAAHVEAAWHQRLHVPLTFLMGAKSD